MSLRKKLVGTGAGLALAAGAILGVGSQASASPSGALGLVCGDKAVIDGTFAQLCVGEQNGMYLGAVRYGSKAGGKMEAFIGARGEWFGQCRAILDPAQVASCYHLTVPIKGNSPSDLLGQVIFTDSAGTLHVIVVDLGGQVEPERS